MLTNLSGFFQTLFKKKPTRKILSIVIILAVFSLFFAESYFSIDPDFGWHLRLGRIISSSGIPRTDPMSYTMSSYPFVDHEWLTDVITAFLYKTVGYAGLSVLFAAVATLALVISLWKVKFKWWIPLVLWGVILLLQFSGVRDQVLDWLFIAVLMKLLFDAKLWQKWKILTPLLMLLWVNLHGGFIIGLGILAFVIPVKMWEQKKFDRQNMVILVLSFLATLLNPYGLWVYHEIFLTLTDTYLRQMIEEWGPLWSRFVLGLEAGIVVFMVISTALLIKFRSKFSLSEIGLFFIFLVFAATSYRNIPVWAILSLPIAGKALENLDFKGVNKKLRLLIPVFYIITLSIFSIQTFNNLISNYNTMEQFRYPKQLIANLNTVKLKGNIFDQYGWGGYLEWKLPNQKYFIDGRMPSWRWNSAPKSQSNYAFKDYWYVVQTGDFEKTFDKYNIRTVIWPTNLFQTGKTPDLARVVLTFNINTNQPLLKALRNHGWKLAYADYITLVYEKPN